VVEIARWGDRGDGGDESRAAPCAVGFVLQRRAAHRRAIPRFRTRGSGFGLALIGFVLPRVLECAIGFVPHNRGFD
jgi:hypothetical protein